MDKKPDSLFIPFPAIDLRGGKVVRLKEGDPGRQTAYHDRPDDAARVWLDAGAGWLHVVNLDGAFGEGDKANRLAMAKILALAGEYQANVQFGGGLRSAFDVEEALGLGVARCIVGTMAVEAPEALRNLVDKYGPEKIGASLDCREGIVQVRGWKDGSTLTAIAAAQNLFEAGLRWLVYTDIARDGMQTGINLASTAALARASGMRVIASGGVKSADDILAARRAGLAGIIAGRALYEGTLSIEEMLAAARESG